MTSCQDAEIPNQSVVHAVHGGCWSARTRKGKTTPLNQVKLATVGEEEEDAGAAAAGMENFQTENRFNLTCEFSFNVKSYREQVRGTLLFCLKATCC